LPEFLISPMHAAFPAHLIYPPLFDHPNNLVKAKEYVIFKKKSFRTFEYTCWSQLYVAVIWITCDLGEEVGRPNGWK
jgi:hypothetical protein